MSDEGVEMGMPWTREAEERLQNVPFFVRWLVRRRAEQLAGERNLTVVTEEILRELREKEHTGPR